ncbi:MAG: hypothetical protein SGARI_007215, partial [Bacillariaceae sp.]
MKEENGDRDETASALESVLQRLHDLEEDSLQLKLRCEDLEDENEALRGRVAELEADQKENRRDDGIDGSFVAPISTVLARIDNMEARVRSCARVEDLRKLRRIVHGFLRTEKKGCQNDSSIRPSAAPQQVSPPQNRILHSTSCSVSSASMIPGSGAGSVDYSAARSAGYGMRSPSTLPPAERSIVVACGNSERGPQQPRISTLHRSRALRALMTSSRLSKNLNKNAF